MGGYKFRSSRNAGGVFASTVVLTIAIFGGLVIGSAMFPRDTGRVWVGVIAGSIVTLLLIWLLRDRPDGTLRDSFAWLSRKPAEASVDYEPQLKQVKRVRYGTNRPPTAEELRDLKEGDRNWVPSNTPAGQRRPRRK